jgi:hypothetical protein
METLTEQINLTLTPALRQRLQDFAAERGWYETAAARRLAGLAITQYKKYQVSPERRAARAGR